MGPVGKALLASGQLPLSAFIHPTQHVVDHAPLAPHWPPAANLTQAGLAGWTFENFERAMKEGVSRNGVALREPMSSLPKMAQRMTNTEMQALCLCMKELPSQPSGK